MWYLTEVQRATAQEENTNGDEDGPPSEESEPPAPEAETTDDDPMTDDESPHEAAAAPAAPSTRLPEVGWRKRRRSTEDDMGILSQTSCHDLLQL